MEDFFELGPEHKISRNAMASELVSKAIKKGEGELTEWGSLVVKTGKHTGRAAQDKYVVKDAHTEKNIWWENDVREMKPETFFALKEKALANLKIHDELHVMERSVGATPEHNLGIRLITPSASHALFSRHLFRDEIKAFDPEKDFTIIHVPRFKVNPEEFKSRSETVIVTYFEERTIIIAGTFYAGEIKKSVFSIMNYLLPEKDVLPMHCGANTNKEGEVSIFFGLSGTGKTTLSTDEGKLLIGDDEHGLSMNGVFNFEGGCYAKTHNLTREGEPDIYDACHSFGSILENVVMDPQRKTIDFFDASISENGRASYGLNKISGRVESSVGPCPQHIFYLCADAFGVLPLVSKLTKDQSLFYFLSGYTAKVAGTEMGVKVPSATFSACFGAPFMLRRPQIYAGLLDQYLKERPTQVWLVNTGWIGGPYGVGKRADLGVTRQIIRDIQSNQVNKTKTFTMPIFGLEVPETLPNVDAKLLNPRELWDDLKLYDQQAEKLANMFVENIKRFSDLNEKILSGGPTGMK